MYTDEVMEEDDVSPLEALGLHRVGEPPPRPAASNPTATIPLNNRGTPARIRKKNKMYFDDSLVSCTSPRGSPRKFTINGNTQQTITITTAFTSTNATPSKQSTPTTSSGARKHNSVTPDTKLSTVPSGLLSSSTSQQRTRGVRSALSSPATRSYTANLATSSSPHLRSRRSPSRLHRRITSGPLGTCAKKAAVRLPFSKVPTPVKSLDSDELLSLSHESSSDDEGTASGHKFASIKLGHNSSLLSRKVKDESFVVYDKTTQIDRDSGTDIEPPNLTGLKLECSRSSSRSSSVSSAGTGRSDISPRGAAVPNEDIMTGRVVPPTTSKNMKVEQSDESLLESTRAPDKATITQNRSRLRNFLKLPQAHKWIYYEWFYANIDQPLFLGLNDFEQELRKVFPQLKTRVLSRRQWSLVRRMLGKPRRCSLAFFEEERAALTKKRQVLRLLQQRKITDLSQLKDLPFSLPNHIPCQLVIGTKVTARIAKPESESGLYTGRIDAVDTSDNTYRVNFDRPKIGTRSIPDYEVLSCEAPELMPLASFQHKFRPRPTLGLVTPPRPIMPRTVTSCPGTPLGSASKLFLQQQFGFKEADQLSLDSPMQLMADPVLGQSPRQGSSATGLSSSDTIGQYPVSGLLHIVQLWKLLESKADKVRQLEGLNTSAEKMICQRKELSECFQRRYATLVLEVEHLNEQLNAELLQVHAFCQEISGTATPAPRLLPRQIQERCMAEAVAVVQVSNNSNQEPVDDSHALHLVTALTSLMLQIKNLGDCEVSAFELTALQASVNSLREEVEDKEAFRDLIDVPITHIMAAASKLGPLNAFSTTSK